MRRPKRNNNKVSLFLGSGASAFAGYRTFRNFKDMLDNGSIRETENLPQLHPDTPGMVDEISNFLATCDREPTHDNLLWVLNDYKLVCSNLSKNHKLRNRFENRIHGQFSELERLVNDTIDDITRVSIHHYSRDRIEWAKQHNGSAILASRDIMLFYDILAKYNSASRPRLSLFTTNYDLLIEDLFAHEIYQADYSLITGFGPPPYDGKQWNVDEFKPRNVNSFHLWRLHGCAAWAYHEFRDENVYFHRQDALQQNWRQNACVMFPGREIWRGNRPHAQGFHACYDSVLSSKGIVFIGFSFRDHDVIHLLMVAGHHRLTPARIAIINPELNFDYVRARLQDAASTCTFPVMLPTEENVRIFRVRFGSEKVNHRELANQIITWIEEGKNDETK
jgi:hypothetical protein